MRLDYKLTDVEFNGQTSDIFLSTAVKSHISLYLRLAPLAEFALTYPSGYRKSPNVLHCAYKCFICFAGLERDRMGTRRYHPKLQDFIFGFRAAVLSLGLYRPMKTGTATIIGVEAPAPLTKKRRRRSVPKLGEFVLYLLVPRNFREGILGDLEEDYREAKSKFGTRLAAMLYYKQVATSAWPFARRFLRKLVGYWLVGALLRTESRERVTIYIDALLRFVRGILR